MTNNLDDLPADNPFLFIALIFAAWAILLTVVIIEKIKVKRTPEDSE